MATSPTSQYTDFSLDVLGRYVCNGLLDEALRSADRSRRRDARPFDLVVVGGGSFGPVFAQHLLSNDRAHRHRILVLEAGPLALTEHVQNLPMLGLFPPPPTSIAELRRTGRDRQPRNEIWGLAWHSPIGFPGLAYCIGGRSLFFGGWSPRLLDEEMPEDRWPAAVRRDLQERYFAEAAEQIGTDQTNDFIDGPLHRALRTQLLEGVRDRRIRGAVPLDELPLHLETPARGDRREEMKLEAPLAVQSRTRPGFFPFNKFSSVQLLIKAARVAWAESNGDDVKKRLMVVPQCHVRRLIRAGDRVVRIDTNLGDVELPPGGSVIIATGTVESARLALASFPELATTVAGRMVAHLRSNLTIRVPREAVSALSSKVRELEASALFLKGRHPRGDGSHGFFHIQITAAGLAHPSGDSEAELFKKVPDVDTYEALRQTTDTSVTLTLRGIGEMAPDNPQSFVRLDPELDEFGVPRAFVQIEPSPDDRELWRTMDQATDDLALVFAGGHTYEVLAGGRFVPVDAGTPPDAVLPHQARHDGLGTTHHEAGTLRMGDHPATAVTDGDGRIHGVANAYACGPALFPTVGSPNPMLTGVALGRRLADHLQPPPAPFEPEEGFTALFDGFSTGDWKMAGDGRFYVVDGTLEVAPGGDLGLLWCTRPAPPDFVLRLQWLRWAHEANSGVFVRFPHPDGKGYLNTAYVGVHFGFEVQIDELGAPDGLPVHRTGAIYDQPDQTLSLVASLPAGVWNDFEIRVRGQEYEAFLNGQQTTRFFFQEGSDPHHPDRGLPSTPADPRFVGLQAHPGSRVAFRNLRWRAL